MGNVDFSVNHYVDGSDQEKPSIPEEAKRPEGNSELEQPPIVQPGLQERLPETPREQIRRTIPGWPSYGSTTDRGGKKPN